MPQAPLSFSAAPLTGFLIVIIRKMTELNSEVDRQVFAPPHPPSRNLTFINLEPVVHQVEFRSSPDGVALGTILHQIVYDVKNELISSDSRFYHVNGINAWDPIAEQTDIVDPWLDGKTITEVFRESFRPLEPGIEYDPLPGGGIRLKGGLQFNFSETMKITVSYPVTFSSPPSTGGNLTWKEAPATVALMDATFDNCEINCATASALRLSLTFRPIASIPEKTTWKFMTYDGAQINTVINAAPGEFFRFRNKTVTRIILGRCEFLKIRKIGSILRVTDASEGITAVGKTITTLYRDHLNSIPNDDRLLNGDDYVRIYDHIVNELPVDSKISVPDASIETFVRPANKPGVYILASDSKRFRMPKMTKAFIRYMSTFTGEDTSRDYGYPGGLQKEMVGPHFHPSPIQYKYRPEDPEDTGEYGQAADHSVRRWNIENGVDANQNASTGTNVIAPNSIVKPTENRPENVGMYSLTTS